jgi:hypothetical protein
VPTPNQANQQILSADPAKNFGSFEVLADSGDLDYGLEIKDYSDIKGFQDMPLGLGIRTTVHFLCTSLFFLITLCTYYNFIAYIAGIKNSFMIRLNAKRMSCFQFMLGEPLRRRRSSNSI